ncbi:cytochrome-c oxidase, cbb3-type subunit III [Taklimakanibacter lacteus]|uniref:cytochrome-c oxidase, cbb3-type subunit III n=1 Tax=Taklimakanibacter lacteus TaxID=2268456 RepID=UPI000E66CC7C
MSKIERDDISGTSTTGHEWDGIKELNTPLPRWWLWTFYGTIVWALAYSVVYPAWPLVNSATSGLFGYSSRGEVAKEIAEAAGAQGEWRDRIKAADFGQISQDPKLFEFARAGGAAAFKVNCIQCHGSGAAGGKGYPNLNDDDWLWGGTFEEIHTTLQNGVRFAGDNETRFSQMPAFGDGMLSPDEISSTAEYVLSLSGQPHDAEAAAKGAPLYAANCVSCHGERGEGVRDVGGARLNDAIWLYGGGKESIVAQITRPRQGVMPAWGGRLDDVTIKELAIYVYSLGGGETLQRQ